MQTPGPNGPTAEMISASLGGSLLNAPMQLLRIRLLAGDQDGLITWWNTFIVGMMKIQAHIKTCVLQLFAWLLRTFCVFSDLSDSLLRLWIYGGLRFAGVRVSIPLPWRPRPKDCDRGWISIAPYKSVWANLSLYRGCKGITRFPVIHKHILLWILFWDSFIL